MDHARYLVDAVIIDHRSLWLAEAEKIAILKAVQPYLKLASQEFDHVFGEEGYNSERKYAGRVAQIKFDAKNRKEVLDVIQQAIESSQ